MWHCFFLHFCYKYTLNKIWNALKSIKVIKEKQQYFLFRKWSILRFRVSSKRRWNVYYIFRVGRTGLPLRGFLKTYAVFDLFLICPKADNTHGLFLNNLSTVMISRISFIKLNNMTRSYHDKGITTDLSS